MGQSPRCYIPSFVEIGPPVTEKKIFYHIWRNIGKISLRLIPTKIVYLGISSTLSYILCKISHLLQSITIIRHASAQNAMPKRTISHRMLLYAHYPLLKSGPFWSVKSTYRYIAKWITGKLRWSTPSVVTPLGRGVAGLLS